MFYFRGAGIGGLGITVEGPSESKMSCKDNKDGSCSVEYIPYATGDYDVNITYDGEHIPGTVNIAGILQLAMTFGNICLAVNSKRISQYVNYRLSCVNLINSSVCGQSCRYVLWLLYLLPCFRGQHEAFKNGALTK